MREKNGRGRERTARSAHGSYAMKLPQPDWHVGPCVLDVVQEVDHPLLPPGDARVIQRDLGAELVGAVLAAEEG